MHRNLWILLAGMLMAACSGGPLSPANTSRIDPQSVLGRTWQWESTITAVEKTTVPDPERYTLRLSEDGRAQIRFDCNRGGGTYQIAAGKLSFGPLMSTRMACPPDSLDTVFMRDLQRVVSFFVQEGRLYLELAADGGVMKFNPQK